MKEIYYDPNFYEFRALAETAKMFKTSIQANVNLKDPSSKEQIEIDGLISLIYLPEPNQLTSQAVPNPTSLAG